MGRKTSDIARRYCSRVNNNPNHLRCHFCSHTMWGITRFKEHLAHKRGDVMPCGACPIEVTVEMTEELIQLSLKREERERRIREELQVVISGTAAPPQSNGQERLTVAAATAPSNGQERPAATVTAAAVSEAELAAKEEVLMEEAIKESLKCFEMEKHKAVRNDDDEFEAVLRESMISYREECWRRGAGSSRSRGEAGPSSYGNKYFNVDSDYDSSDLGS